MKIFACDFCETPIYRNTGLSYVIRASETLYEEPRFIPEGEGYDLTGHVCTSCFKRMISKTIPQPTNDTGEQ